MLLTFVFAAGDDPSAGSYGAVRLVIICMLLAFLGVSVADVRRLEREDARRWAPRQPAARPVATARARR